MKESNLRKWHRTLGILLGLFIILQAGSGLLITLGEVSVLQTHADEGSDRQNHGHEGGESIWHKALEFIHHGAGSAGNIYRTLVGIGLLGMAFSGSAIFYKIRARSRIN